MRVESNTTFVPPVTLMSRTEGVAMEVDVDEPVAFLQEVYALNRGNREMRRWQVMGVVRNDRLSAFWRDLGPASDYMTTVDGDEYRQPAYQQPVLFEHTVGECMEMAELGRNDEFAAQHLHEQAHNSDIHRRYLDVIEQDMHLIRNRSTFGPHVRIERNGFSRIGNREQQERMAARHGHR